MSAQGRERTQGALNSVERPDRQPRGRSRNNARFELTALNGLPRRSCRSEQPAARKSEKGGEPPFARVISADVRAAKGKTRVSEKSAGLTGTIGLSQMGDDHWKDGGPCADEYDSYLLGVVGLLRRGQPASDAVSYLEDIEIDHMGGGRNPRPSVGPRPPSPP